MTLTYPEGYTPRLEPHCGVLATAICSGVSFEAAWAELESLLEPWQRQMSSRRGSWRGTTWADQRREALVNLGTGFRVMSGLPGMTLATFVKRHAKPGRTYMVTVTRHVVTVRDGMVIDQHSCGPVDQHPSARKRISREPLEIERSN